MVRIGVYGDVKEYMVLIRGIYGVVYSTMIIGMFRYIIIIIYEVPTQSGLLSAVPFLERRYLSGNVGPMRYRHTGVLASQVSYTRFLSLTLDNSTDFA